MILYVIIAVLVLGGSYLAGMLAIAKASDNFNHLTEGDNNEHEID